MELRPTRNGLDRRTPTTVSPQHPPAQAKPNGRPVGGIYIDVPNWDHRDWAHVAARAKLGPGNISLGFNVPGSEADTANTFPQYPSASRWTTSQAINLGSLARFF